MNIAAIVGNVASEPALRHTEQGKAVCSFRVAVSRASDPQQADFFNVIAWNRQAEMCKHFLDIGRRIAVEGRMHCRIHEGSGGERRSSIELVACRVELLSSIPSHSSSANADQLEAAR